MLIHVFALRWNSEATQERKDQALAAIRDFPQQIAGILALQTGSNLSNNAQGYETIGILHFADQTALQAYLVHPAHRHFVQTVQPFIEAIDLDLEV